MSGGPDLPRRMALAVDIRETARRILAAEPHELAEANPRDELEQAAAWLDRVAGRLP